MYRHGNGKEVYAFNNEIGDEISELEVVRYRATDSNAVVVDETSRPYAA